MENELLSWRRASTKEEWHALAVKSGTSTGYLNLIAALLNKSNFC